MTLRPLWEGAKPEKIQSWHPFSDDLIRFLSDGKSGFDTPSATQLSPVIGVGHSIGATVTLRAALRDPNQFRALVLIEPVLFVPQFLMMWKIVRAIGLGDQAHPLIAGAMKRRRRFDDLETVYRGYRKRRVFRYMSDESLRAYIEGITKPTANGTYELVYSPEWEVQIYRTGLQDFDIWRGLPNLEVPTLIIRGVETDTFLEKAARLVKRKQPKIKIEALKNSTHIVPLEHPKKAFELMQTFLNEVL
jgi:pimeloyl-ACP methyl ester carboxylesterase